MQLRIICAIILGLFAPITARAADPTLPAQETIQVFGVKIAYYELGQGPTLVLVHGYGSSAKGDWGQVMLPLAKHHHVIAPDLLGFGNSAKPLIAYGVQTWVDVLGEFLREKNISDFTMMGESLGGWIAADYSIEALQGTSPGGTDLALPKPSRLVLSDAAGRLATMEALRPQELDPILSLAHEKYLLTKIFHDPARHSDQALQQGMAWSMANDNGWAMMSFAVNSPAPGEAVDGRLGAITIPTLVVWGQYDGLLPLADGRFYAAGIPRGKLVVVPNAGHAPMIEQPAGFLAALAGFL